jgi:hypothetical protein
MWKNTVGPDRPQVAMWRMRCAYWRLKATNTHPEYVIFIASPQQQWLHQPTTMLRYTNIACLAFVYGTQ